MELQIGDTQLKCYEDGCIERLDKRNNKWKNVKGTNDKDGYLKIKIENKWYFFHRILCKVFHEEFELDSQLDIDHINRDKKDNRIENLRAVTHQQNSFNTNAKGFTRNGNGFLGRIKLNDKLLTKHFSTEEEARQWYLDQKAILHVI